MFKLYTIEDILKEYARQDELIRSRNGTPQTPAPKPPDAVPQQLDTVPETEPPKLPEPDADAENEQDAISEEKPRSRIMQLADRYGYLMEQLIRRDFKARYKGTFFGILWSLIAPFSVMLVQYMVFSRFFSKMENYAVYLITGTMIYNFFHDSTLQEMFTLRQNGGIISKINVPKITFFLSKAIACFINFLFVLTIYIIILLITGFPITHYFLGLVFPVTLMFIMNMGIGYVLSGLSLFFKDTQYMYSVFTSILSYFCATFYRIDIFPEVIQKLFYLNPVYCFITYARTLVLEARLPSFDLHLLCIFYALLAVTAAYIFNKKFSNRFIYYI